MRPLRCLNGASAASASTRLPTHVLGYSIERIVKNTYMVLLYDLWWPDPPTSDKAVDYIVRFENNNLYNIKLVEMGAICF